MRTYSILLIINGIIRKASVHCQINVTFQYPPSAGGLPATHLPQARQAGHNY